MKNNNKGFTLIELLVVIAIIGLLSTLAVVSLNNARAKARDSKRVADVKQMQTALELFFNECDGYPTFSNDGTDDVTYVNNANFRKLDTTAYYDSDNTADNNECASGAEFGQFMPKIPDVPTPTDNDTDCSTGDGWEADVANTYYYAACDSTGATCDGSSSNNGASYAIEYCLGQQTGGIPAGLHYATPAGMEL